MERKNKEIAAQGSYQSKSYSTAIFRWLLGHTLSLLIKIYFLVPDLINLMRKYVAKKKTAARKISINTPQEKIPQLHEFEYSGK